MSRQKNEKEFEFVVRLRMFELMDDDLPIIRQVAKDQLKQHIQEAVYRWGGQLHPQDFLHTNNIKRVAVTTKKGT